MLSCIPLFHVLTAALIRYMAKPKKVVGKNLLGGENGPSARSLLPWLSAANATDNATAVAEVPLTPEVGNILVTVIFPS